MAAYDLTNHLTHANAPTVAICWPVAEGFWECLCSRLEAIDSCCHVLNVGDHICPQHITVALDGLDDIHIQRVQLVKVLDLVLHTKIL